MPHSMRSPAWSQRHFAQRHNRQTMADTTRLSVRVPTALANSSRESGPSHRSFQELRYVTIRALEEYCASEEDLMKKLEEGMADADGGRVVSHERVRPWLLDLEKGKIGRAPQVR